MVTIEGKINEANNLCVNRIMESYPVLVDIDQALEVIPKMESNMLIHGGYPQLKWEEMIGPMKGAVIGAMVYEGWASSEKEALKRIKRGDVIFSSTANHGAAAPMAGIISPSMPAYIIKNKTYGNFAFSNVNEGLGKTLRFGAYDKGVIDRLHWIEKVLMPALKMILKKYGEIDIKELIMAALRRGDECHNRNKTVSLMFLNSIASKLVRSDIDRNNVADIIDFIGGNVHFFLNLSMASSKASLDAAHDIEYSTVVTGLTTNGVNFGMRVSGLGNRWFTAPSILARGKYFEGFDESCAAPVFGDSYYSEPAGLGGFAMAAAPAIVSFIGGEPDLGIKTTKEMYEITTTEHKYYKIANLGYRGTPLGIDIRKVLRTGILPIINTGIAHKNPGVGQVGAGRIRLSLELFKKAWGAFKRKYQIEF